MKVAVGSTNPVKIEATRAAFKKIWGSKNVEILYTEVSSGVGQQPLSDAEAIKGAKRRALKALVKLNANFGVGIEAGLQNIGNQWFTCGWVVIIDRKGKVGIGSSFRMQTPKKVIKLIRKGHELGAVTDLIFKTQNSKRKAGYFGLMTKNALTRTEAYRDGIISALARFIRPTIYH